MYILNGKALEILNKYYGYSSFRKGQEEIIHEIINGTDVSCIMPTGGGKSICYQIPALLMEGITLVISPLISLMKDQVDTLRNLGIKAAYINSSLDEYEILEIINDLKNNEIKILYIAPERLQSQDFINSIRNINISLVAVDEAHCVSQWGHDFRVSYKYISGFVSNLSVRPTVAAFTATATEDVRRDIVSLLSLENPKIFITGFNRENLEIEVLKGVNKKSYILDYLTNNKDESGIIYAATRKECDALCEFLNSKGFSTNRYHAGLKDEERAKIQEDFVYDKTPVIIATNAFGMGIDKSNVRFVIHYNIPKNLESYYQEIGRAGRDGEDSSCILLFSPSDVHTQKYLIDVSTDNTDRKTNEYKKLQNMVDMVYSNNCYKGFILDYFGEEHGDNCSKCSNCNSDAKLVDKTVDAQKVLSCVYRMKRPYGTTMIIDVLRGSSNKKLLSVGLDEISTYGIMKNYSKDNLKEFINTLISHKFIDSVEGDYPVVRLNNISIQVLKGEEKVFLREEVKAKKLSVNNDLYELLRTLRKDIAMEENIPPYVVFGDTSLKEMSTRYPRNSEEFLDINGVGESKCEKYGERFLNIINEYVDENNIDVKWIFTKKSKTATKTSSSEEKNSNSKEKSNYVTVNMLKEMPFKDVAKERKLMTTTMFNHIMDYVKDEGNIDFNIDFTGILKDDNEAIILNAIEKVGYDKLRPIKDEVPSEITYDEIKSVIVKKFFVKTA